MTRLGDVCEYRNESIAAEAATSMPLYISTDSMMPNRGPIFSSTLPNTGKVKRFQAGDTLVSNIRPYFKKIWRADAEGACSNDVLVFTPTKCLPDYLHWILSSDDFFSFVTKTSKGTKMPRGDKRAIMNYSVQVPSETEQHTICAIMDSLQKKITINGQLNDYLSQICDAEFTDFVSNQRDASWHDGTLNELVEIRYGKDHKKLAEGPYPVYGSGGFMRSVEKPLSSGESVLIPRKGSLNNVMYVDEKFWTVDTMFFTIPLKPGAAKYVYQYTKRLDFGTMNSGSAVPSMTTKILNSLVIPIPSDSALVSFNKKLQPFFDLFGKNEEENRRLVSLRDILLPKLMSGEIDVSKVDLTQLTNNHLADC